ncbi:3-oxoacyl-[acyl-carrier-protein] synthase 3 [Spirochaetia bacterium]|nr:3-oxoacyl-[acyl-carrier-protein] synthase 3 [Spirochaetia bacterium]
MAIEIIATGRSVPPNRVTNEDLADRMETSDEWIRSHTGIGARHIADENVSSSDLGFAAAEQALALAIEQGKVAEKSIAELAETIDLIILGSSTPDYNNCPATSCIIQQKIGAKNAGAMDVNIACSSFIYGLEAAAGMLTFSSSRNRALVIGAETLSRIVDWNDRGSCILFGDGAGAVLIEKTDAPVTGEGKRGLIRTILGADGSGQNSLIVRRGGSRNPYKRGEITGDPPHLEMNGREVYNFAVKAIADTIAALLESENIAVSDIARIIPHQANARIVQAAGKRLNIPEEKFYLNIHEYANTSAASIPLALDELNRAGQIRRGDLLMTVGFGAGLSYGGNVIVW